MTGRSGKARRPDAIAVAPIQRDSPLPLYQQIANVLRSNIVSGEWDPGERIPGEGQLARSFGVSTMTMRQALNVLSRDGWIERRQGLGTFVNGSGPPDHHVDLSIPLSAVASPIADLEVTVLGLDQVRPPAPVRAAFGLDPTQTCVRVRRTRGGQDGLVTYATTYVPNALGADLNREELGDSLMLDILERRGVVFAGAHQTIEASLADPETATVLGLPLGSAILLIRRTFELADGSVGYIVYNRHPSHMFRYEMRLQRGDGAPSEWDVARTVAVGDQTAASM